MIFLISLQIVKNERINAQNFTLHYSDKPPNKLAAFFM